MAIPRWEVASGVIDGVNTVFTVSVAYIPGTTSVHLNGQLKRADLDDGWTESVPASGQITLKNAPKAIGDEVDVVQVFYLDTSPDTQEIRVLRSIVGRLSTTGEIHGRLVS